MRCLKTTSYLSNIKAVILILAIPEIYSVTVKDVFNLNTQKLVRVPRDSKYYLSRYGTSSTNEAPLSRSLKPEESPEAREDSQAVAVGKRCVRCDTGYIDRYDSRPRYEDRDRRTRYDDRSERYDRYDRYDDRDRDRDRDRYSDRDRYDRYDRYSDRDRYSERKYDDYDRYDRYDRDRYDRGRYEPRDRYYDRGVGYDNRGYDNRDRYDRESYRPWDETYRGVSGFDGSGKGYYFASARPDYGSSRYGSGYASSWNYGGGRNEYGSDRYGGGYNRPRDPYDGYRGTSYLYGRPSSTTTNRPTHSDNDTGITQSPQQENPSG